MSEQLTFGDLDEFTTEIWCIRHGEAESNVERRVAGQSDVRSGLTLLGKLQAHSTAVLLNSFPSDLYFDSTRISDLRRTKETASIILKALKCPTGDMALTGICREKLAGPTLLNQRWGATKRAATRAGKPVGTYRPPNGESWEDVRLRARRMVHEFGRGTRNLVVSHGGWIKMLPLCLGSEPIELRLCDMVTNCSLSVVRFVRDASADHMPFHTRVETQLWSFDTHTPKLLPPRAVAPAAVSLDGLPREHNTPNDDGV